MKVVIAGSRWLIHKGTLGLVRRAVRESGFDVAEVVSGCAPGVDLAGEEFAREEGLPVKRFPADWSKGRAAGPIRNGKMAAYADALVALPHPTKESRGTADMVRQMRRAGKPVFVLALTAEDLAAE